MKYPTLQRLVFAVCLVASVALLTTGQEISEGISLGVLPTPTQPDGLWIKLELPDRRSAFTVGENIRLALTTNKQAYVYVFDITPTHQVLNIFPNEFANMRNPLRSGELILPDNDQYTLTVTKTGGLGQEFFGAIASTQPIPEFEAKSKVLGALLGKSLEEFQSNVSSVVQGVSPKPIQSELKYFNIAFIRIQTTEEQIVPTKQGSIIVKSNPPARLLIDDHDQGYTLSDEFRTLPLNVGSHQLKLKRQGFQDFVQTATVNDNKERIFDVALNRLPMAHLRFTPAQPVLGQPIYFSSAESEDLDGTIVNYAWDFNGDGQIDETAIQTTRFFMRGTHNVTLTVTDDKGATSTTSETITLR